MSNSNYTNSLNNAIDRLEGTLEQARNLPEFAATILVLGLLLCAIILLHALALLAAAPCIYEAWKRRRAAALQDRARLLSDGEGVIELGATAEGEEGGEPGAQEK